MPDDSARQPARIVFQVSCYHCTTVFDALAASWCGCVVKERTLACPNCLRCFCAAPRVYKQRFWVDAPQELWQAKIASQRVPILPPNPPLDAVRRPLICVVDDDADILTVAHDIITRRGYGVIVASNGREALDLVSVYHPSLVITDALMPKLDGRELCLAIKSNPATASTRVVIMTSVYTTGIFKREALTVFRADDFLAKPVSDSTLSAILLQHLPLPEAPPEQQEEPAETPDVFTSAAEPILLPQEAPEEEVQWYPPPALIAVEAPDENRDDEAEWLASIGLDAALLRAFRTAGPVFSLAEVATLHLLKITPAYVERMHRTVTVEGGLSASDLADLHECGVDAEYAVLCRGVIAMMTVDDLIAFKRGGIEHEFLRVLTDAGAVNLNPSELLSCARLGITPSFLAEVARDSRERLSFRELVRLRLSDRRRPNRRGVDPELAEELRRFPRSR